MDQAALTARVRDTGVDVSCRPIPVYMTNIAGKVLAFIIRNEKS